MTLYWHCKFTVNAGDVEDRGLDAESALFDGCLGCDNQLSSDIAMKLSTKICYLRSQKIFGVWLPQTGHDPSLMLHPDKYQLKSHTKKCHSQHWSIDNNFLLSVSLFECDLRPFNVLSNLVIPNFLNKDAEFHDPYIAKDPEDL